ncbi:hypothetical protein GNI_081360 [Gregarina niphandrodes]|uniref:Uncharacterized protein n=1 Tax=Gregarina niphandrodes TaxID=110365 RepID=A0A023B6A3_GRENI|nr:hypothetical protein GNI_081360 [Gregarina niphandrodes]EZG65926.1 hypothetical protein GNI_081360 [Gregarina niphandrodes]|eukprot:XP_011134020.1 hypothetical protein GNI_081360 [Gregarina niphandrodes]
MVAECSTAALLAGFVELDPERHKGVFEFHAPLFSADRLFVKDSIVMTFVAGGTATTRDRKESGNLAVDYRSAYKTYKNWVRGAEWLAAAVMRYAEDDPVISVWPGYCGFVDWGPVSAFYEPLLLPGNRPLKRKPADILHNTDDYNRAVATLCQHPGYEGFDSSRVLHWFQNGISSLYMHDPLFGGWLVEWYRRLNLSELPVGLSDLRNLLWASKTNVVTSVECILYWTILEGELGLLHFRNLAELLPPLAFSPTMMMLPNSIAGSQVQQTQASNLSRHCINLQQVSAEGPRLITIPDMLLRRCPLDVLVLRGEQGSDVGYSSGMNFPTFASWALSHDAAAWSGAGATLLMSLRTGLLEFWHGNCITGYEFRKWVKSYGLGTRDVCQYVLLNPLNVFHAHLQALAMRELVTKALKRHVQQGLRLQRARKLSQQQAPQVALPRPYDPRFDPAQVVRHFFASSTAVMDEMARWFQSFRQNVAAQSAAWWEQNVTPDFTALLTVTASSPLLALPSATEVLDNVKKVSEIARLPATLLATCLRAGLRFDLGEEAPTYRFLGTCLRQVGEGVLDSVVQRASRLLRAAADAAAELEVKLPEHVFPRVLLACGSGATRRVRAADDQRAAALERCWHSPSSFDYRSRGVPQQAEFSERTALRAVSYGLRPLGMSHGAVGRLSAQLRHRKWPCQPLCVREPEGLCSVWAQYARAVEAGFLIGLYCAETEVCECARWPRLLLEYAYAALQHGELDVAYHCAIRVARLRAETLPRIEDAVRARYLLFEVACDASIPLEHAGRLYRAWSDVKRKPLSTEGRFDTIRCLEDIYAHIPAVQTDGFVSGQQTVVPLFNLTLATRLMAALSGSAAAGESSEAKLLSKTVSRLLETTVQLLQLCHSQYVPLPPLLLLAFRARISYYRRVCQLWPEGTARGSLRHAFAGYLMEAREAPCVSDKVFGVDVYYFCLLRCISEHRIAKHRSRDLRPVPVDELVLPIGASNVNRQECDPDGSIAQLCWLASVLVESSASPLQPECIGALILCGKDLVVRSISDMASAFTDMRGPQDAAFAAALRDESLGLRVDSRLGDENLNVDYLFAPGYHPKADRQLRALQRVLGLAWYNPSRQRLLEVATNVCYRVAYYRLVLKLKNLRQYKTVTLRDLRDGQTVVQEVPLEHADQTLAKLRELAWEILCAKALGLSETQEMALVSQWQTQGTYVRDRVQIRLNKSLGDNPSVGINHAFVQEEYQSLRDYLTRHLDERTRQGIIDQCLAWCDRSEYPGIQNYVLDRTRTPARWFTDHVLSGGSLESSVIFDIIRGSHTTHWLRAKWLIHYLSSVVGLRRAESAREDAAAQGPAGMRHAAVYNQWMLTARAADKVVDNLPALLPVVRMRRS